MDTCSEEHWEWREGLLEDVAAQPLLSLSGLSSCPGAQGEPITFPMLQLPLVEFSCNVLMELSRQNVLSRYYPGSLSFPLDSNSDLNGGLLLFLVSKGTHLSSWLYSLERTQHSDCLQL